MKQHKYTIIFPSPYSKDQVYDTSRNVRASFSLSHILWHNRHTKEVRFSLSAPRGHHVITRGKLSTDTAATATTTSSLVCTSVLVRSVNEGKDEDRVKHQC